MQEDRYVMIEDLHQYALEIPAKLNKDGGSVIPVDIHPGTLIERGARVCAIEGVTFDCVSLLLICFPNRSWPLRSIRRAYGFSGLGVLFKESSS